MNGSPNKKLHDQLSLTTRSETGKLLHRLKTSKARSDVVYDKHFASWMDRLIKQTRGALTQVIDAPSRKDMLNSMVIAMHTVRRAALDYPTCLPRISQGTLLHPKKRRGWNWRVELVDPATNSTQITLFHLLHPLTPNETIIGKTSALIEQHPTKAKHVKLSIAEALTPIDLSHLSIAGQNTRWNRYDMIAWETLLQPVYESVFYSQPNRAQWNEQDLQLFLSCMMQVNTAADTDEYAEATWIKPTYNIQISMNRDFTIQGPFSLWENTLQLNKGTPPVVIPNKAPAIRTVNRNNLITVLDTCMNHVPTTIKK